MKKEKQVKQGVQPKKRANKYDDKLAVNASFIDIINAAVKDTKANVTLKK